ncbi:MAG: hypothetical protein IM568_01185 [Flavobacterium sp.]|nr:hypothetical protein [Flavobacterium sp.]
MKKLATTFGLLALMLIVTSFTTPNEIGGKGTSDRGVGNTQFEIGGKGTSDRGVGNTQFEIGGKGTSDRGVGNTQ